MYSQKNATLVLKFLVTNYDDIYLESSTYSSWFLMMADVFLFNFAFLIEFNSTNKMFYLENYFIFHSIKIFSWHNDTIEQRNWKLSHDYTSGLKSNKSIFSSAARIHFYVAHKFYYCDHYKTKFTMINNFRDNIEIYLRKCYLS